MPGFSSRSPTCRWRHPPTLAAVRITPGGVFHRTGYTNAFVLSGMLSGSATFSGKTTLVLDKGEGPVLAESSFFNVTGPEVGAFDCRSANRIEGYPGPDFTLTGSFFSCEGTGAYEDRHMMGTYVNIPGTMNIQIASVIW